MMQNVAALRRPIAPAFLLLGCLALFLFVLVALPLAMLAVKSFQDRGGDWVGLDNYLTFLSSPALGRAVFNSLVVAGSTTVITLALAFPSPSA